jgi:hypothetical protein
MRNLITSSPGEEIEDSILTTYSFSPHSLQNMESARFSLPQEGQDFVLVISSTGVPQREQNLALGVKFLVHLLHLINTSC